MSPSGYETLESEVTGGSRTRHLCIYNISPGNPSVVISLTWMLQAERQPLELGVSTWCGPEEVRLLVTPCVSFLP